MRIVTRGNQADGAGELPRIVALSRSGTIASFLCRPLGERRPPRRLQAVANVPVQSRIVLRSTTPR
jgi:hypothetical protein